MDGTQKKRSSSGILWLILGVLITLAISVIIGLAGFALGRSSSPQAITEVVTETVEVQVTREVPIIVESGEQLEDTGEEANQSSPENPKPTPTPAPAEPDPQPSTFQADESGLDFSIFHEVWEIVERDFDGDLLDADDRVYSAIDGSLAALGDNFTTFIRPELAARLREDMGGSVSGIGAFVQENEEGFFEIITPIEGQPADLAGLLPGDIVLAVDGESVIGVSFDEVILMVRGPSGTMVTLTIGREGEEEPLEFSIVRANFEVPVVESEMLADDIAYIHLLEFNRTADDTLAATLIELLGQNPAGLILDLRNNPGGFLDQSIAVADAFLPESVILYERNNKGLDQVFRAENGDLAESIPLVVLVNEASASASEIVAGAIQDNGRGIVIGAQTFGKGSVQTVHELSDGSELRVTIARWYTPANNSIEEAGITPDIEVESPMELGGEDDQQLQRAAEYIRNGQ